MDDQEKPGIPPEELADEAGAGVTPLPEDELDEDASRGAVLPDDADERPVPPDEDLVEDA